MSESSGRYIKKATDFPKRIRYACEGEPWQAKLFDADTDEPILYQLLSVTFINDVRDPNYCKIQVMHANEVLDIFCPSITLEGIVSNWDDIQYNESRNNEIERKMDEQFT